MKDYVESRISSVNARIDEMEESSGGLTRVIMTSSETFVAPADIVAKVTVIGGGGGGGQNGWAVSGSSAGGGGGKKGGTTSFGNFCYAIGGAGGGGGGGHANTSAVLIQHGGGGGGGSGETFIFFVNLVKSQPVSCIVGAGGQGGAQITNSGTGAAGESSPATGFHNSFIGGAGGAIFSTTSSPNAGKGGQGCVAGGAGSVSELSTSGRGIGGYGGVYIFGYGCGGGGGGDNQVGVAFSTDNEGSALAPFHGGNGGSGAIIIEYIKT
jgi:hypothetical protein